MVDAPMGVLYAYLNIIGVPDIHLRGAFVHCSFRLTGQCESLQIVERAKSAAPRFYFLCYHLTYLLTPRGSPGNTNE